MEIHGDLEWEVKSHVLLVQKALFHEMSLGVFDSILRNDPFFLQIT